MSFSSRKLLTKIYDLNINISNSKKKKGINNYGIKNKINRNKETKNIREVINTERNVKDNNKIKLNQENLKTIDTNKFPIIPKLNLNNINNKINGIDENKEIKEIITTKENTEKNILLDYQLIEASSEDNNHPLNELKNSINNLGWQSARFCEYPQYIFIQFIKPVFIKKIEISLHENNIPSIIKFYSYSPKNKNELISNYKEASYEFIGIIKTNINEKTNHKMKDFCRIYPNVKSLFLKIELEKNYFNIHNLFNQIGLMKLDFFGEYLDYIGGSEENNKIFLKYTLKKNNYDDIDLIGICDEQLNELKKQMKHNIDIENYMECKEIKTKREKIKLYGQKICELETEKKIALNNADFSKAIQIKNLIDKIKIAILNISNPNISRLNENKLILSDRYIEKNFYNDKIYQKKYSDFLNNINEKFNENNLCFENINISPLGSHDETVLPSVLRKLKKEENKVEKEIDEINKGKLENISNVILEEYIGITEVLGEENMKKIFSKQILWKEEGLNILKDKLFDILNYNKKDYNEIINNIFKLCISLLEETHPSIVIKIIDIIKNLFNYIQNKKIKTDLEEEIKNDLLIKIKKKLGDINPKIRAKAVILYSYMLSLEFCDFDSLIEKLIKEDINNNKSNNLIMAKLDIFNYVFNSFDELIKSNRADKNKFPADLIIDYLIKNISNNNIDIRKKVRNIMKLLLNIFGVENFLKKLDMINEREMIELMNEIPELEEFLYDKINIKKKLQKIKNNEKNIFNNKSINVKSKRNTKLLFKINKSFSTKKDVKDKSLHIKGIK